MAAGGVGKWGGLVSGCVTAPSQPSDLGEESDGPKVTGSATYIGFFGLSAKDKHEVYERALKDALISSPPGTEKLSDVKLWETRYLSANAGIIILALMPLMISGGTDPSGITDGVSALAGFVVGGLEVTKFTVVGVPVVPSE